jgi:hypothetical protein
MNRKLTLALCAIVAAVLVTSASIQVSAGTFPHLNHLTFNKPVALPGVVLTPGAYTFEAGPNGSSREIVLVRARATGVAIYQGFTREVKRPLGMPANSTVAFGEAPEAVPMPIDVWFPLGSEIGHQFLYR